MVSRCVLDSVSNRSIRPRLHRDKRIVPKDITFENEQEVIQHGASDTLLALAGGTLYYMTNYDVTCVQPRF
jgi:hypothetical protein